MKRENERTGTLLTATSIVASSMYATVVATGLLTIGLSVTAVIKGTSFVDYYQYVFPQFRGGATAVHIPAFGYVAFIVYIAIAASVAIHTRKRITQAWSRRRNVR
jgi:hypothetical protein